MTFLSPPPSSFLILLVLVVSILVSSAQIEPDNVNENNTRKHEINENSVVLITGAASHLGSQLAITLHQTYNVSKLILIDEMNSRDIYIPPNSNFKNKYYNKKEDSGEVVEGGGGGGGIGEKKYFNSNNKKNGYEEKTENEFFTMPDKMEDKKRSQDSLSSFEYKRQRIFHVLQTIGNDDDGEDRVVFYKADIRPAIPQFMDYSKFPILDYIFELQNMDHNGSTSTSTAGSSGSGRITHIVHLDHEMKLNPNVTDQIIPRRQDDTQFGMMDGLLEQLRVQKEKYGLDSVPHFTYGSSSEIYNYPDGDGTSTSSNYHNHRGIFSEDWNITIPRSSFGTSKLLDEILAKEYNDIYGINSIGLRFFHVYGPWSTPGSILYEMAERAISSKGDAIPMPTSKEALLHNIHDYIYIDDAIDLIVAAMQFNPLTTPSSSSQPSFVVNVGSGQGSSIADISEIMETYFPRNEEKAQLSNIVEQIRLEDEDVINAHTENQHQQQQHDDDHSKKVIASLDRAEALLGFKPRISLEDGIIRTLAWHYDRSYPFGDGRKRSNSNYIGFDDKLVHDNQLIGAIKNAGIQSCSPLDRECLQGTAIFPCASDCSHVDNCVPSIYDDIISVSKAITESCEDVMYTVDLRKELFSITDPQSSLSGENCNIAFVNENSLLMMRLKHMNGIASDKNIGDELVQQSSGGYLKSGYMLKDNVWTILPLSIPPMSKSEFQRAQLLPKLSPGYFFSTHTKYALYCNSNIRFKNVRSLLQIVKTQPGNAGIAGNTIMMFGAEAQAGQTNSMSSSTFQQKAYDSIKMSLRNRMYIPKFLSVDTSWLIHTLSSSDAHSLRCDIYGEVTKWRAADDMKATDFILSMNNYWSSALALWNNVLNTWWQDQHGEMYNNDVEGGERFFNENKIKINSGYWLAIPYTKNFAFVRLLPPATAGVDIVPNNKY